MPYEKSVVLSPSQKMLRRAVTWMPAVPLLVGGIGAAGLQRIGFDKVPAAFVYAVLAIIMLGVISLFVVFSIRAYWLREHRRWIYGLLEVAFAFVVVIVATYNSLGSSPGAPTGWSFPMLSTFAQYAAGLYIMVRGFDNIGQGVKDDAIWGRRWRWFSLQQIHGPDRLKK